MYINTRNNPTITGIEFSPAEGGTISYIYLSKDADKSHIRQILQDTGQTIIAEPQTENSSLIIARGNTEVQDVLKQLSETGDRFMLESRKKKMNPWAWRGGLSVIGQSLQIASGALAINKVDVDIPRGITRPEKFDLALIWFAIPNLAANIINYVFGAQKSEDIYGQAKIRSFIADEVNKYAPADGQVQPTDIAPNADKAKSSSHSASAFLRRYSVVFGEVGLRVLGSFSMAFSPANWKTAFPELFRGNFAEAYKLGRTTDRLTHISGLGMLLGKFISFFPKTPDPNNPKPNNWFDNLREKYLFKASSAVEFSATSVLLYDRYKKKALVINGKVQPEYFGLLGNSVFDAGYMIRWFAPFGKKVVDMNKVNAYITDGLARIPEDKRADAAATIALKLKEQMGDAAPPLAQLHTHIVQDSAKLSAAITPQEEAPTAFTNSEKPRTRLIPQAKNMQERVTNSRADANILPAL